VAEIMGHINLEKESDGGMKMTAWSMEFWFQQ